MTTAFAATLRSLDRLPGNQASATRSSKDGAIAIAELRALNDIDDILPPEELGDPSSKLVLHPAADLRLPQPPVRATTGDQLFRALSTFVGKLEVRERCACSEERKMGALLRGIHGLELEIRSLMSKTTRV